MADNDLIPAAELVAKNKAHFPNESPEYRRARNALLTEEIELRRHIESVANLRRALPPGGVVPEDYAFEGPNGTVRALAALRRQGHSGSVQHDVWPAARTGLPHVYRHAYILGRDCQKPARTCCCRSHRALSDPAPSRFQKGTWVAEPTDLLRHDGRLYPRLCQRQR